MSRRGNIVLRIFVMAVVMTTGTVALAAKPNSDETNTLTHGMAQMTLKVGETSQLDVVTAFGAPNITTLDGQGQEVWIYDRHATVTASSGSSFSIGMLFGGVGSAVGGAGGLGFGSSKAKASQSTRSMTLIIKFGADKKVSDFKSRTSSF